MISRHLLRLATYLDRRAYERGARYPQHVMAIDWLAGRLAEAGL